MVLISNSVTIKIGKLQKLVLLQNKALLFNPLDFNQYETPSKLNLLKFFDLSSWIDT